MNCGIPYCHTGCPVNNQIPDWNDLVYRNDWQDAILNLHSTNNFPEFTGRICPAPCEAACTLNLDRDAGHHQDDRMHDRRPGVGERLGQAGTADPDHRQEGRGRRLGTGGDRLRAAAARAGHEVHLYEKLAKAGGLLTYGIPDFKMEKHIVFRRIAQMEAEGVIFHYDAHVGVNVPIEQLLAEYDAIVLAGGAEKSRDLPIPGRELGGIHFAMDFLPQQNRRVGNEPPATRSRSSPAASTWW